MYDYHIHSNYSGDSGLPMKDACERAIRLGLKEIAFVDHLDVDYPDYDYVFEVNFGDYSRKIDELNSIYKGRLKIIKGIEIGIQPHVLEETKRRVDAYNFDFIISSVHAAEKKDFHSGAYYKDKSAYEAFKLYFDELLFSVNNYTDYDVQGHLDIVRRYNSYYEGKVDYSEFFELIDSILKKIIADNKGIEINTSGFKYNVNTAIPDIDLLERYKKLGGEIITVGSDAHSFEYIAYKFDVVYEMLKKAGFSYITTYDKRKPSFIKIA